LHCAQLYKPDPRNRWHQKYCSAAACQEVSHIASQRHWRRSKKGRDYFQGPANLDRVRKWRKIHPGYWKKRRKKPLALRDVLFVQPRCLPRDARVLNSADVKISELFPTHVSSTSRRHRPIGASQRDPGDQSTELPNGTRQADKEGRDEQMEGAPRFFEGVLKGMCCSGMAGERTGEASRSLPSIPSQRQLSLGELLSSRARRCFTG